MIDFIKTPEVIAAIIAAITSIITLGLTLLTKNSIEKRLLIFRLNSGYKFEQRKKNKKCIGFKQRTFTDSLRKFEPSSLEFL